MLFCLLLGCLISLLIIPLMLLPSLRRSLPLPERRGEQDVFVPPTPTASASRAGGMALAMAFVGVSLLICFLYPAAWTNQSRISLGILWTALAMFAIGSWDDYRPMSVGRRLLIQTLVSIAACLQGVQIEPAGGPFSGISAHLGAWSGVLTVFWLVGLTNLFHRVNSINGLAGCLGLVLMTLLAYSSAGAGAAFPALCAFGMAGALLGFLVYNLPPTRTCMGSGGAGLIGFLAGSFSLVHPDREVTMAAALVLVLPALGLCLTFWPRAPKPSPSTPSGLGGSHRRATGLGTFRGGDRN